MARKPRKRSSRPPSASVQLLPHSQDQLLPQPQPQSQPLYDDNDDGNQIHEEFHDYEYEDDDQVYEEVPEEMLKESDDDASIQDRAPPPPPFLPHPSPKTSANNADQPLDRQFRVYADGIYDLFHFGHARSLEQAKKLFPNTYLLVGCCSDAITHKYKGKTVMTDRERYESLRHCKCSHFWSYMLSCMSLLCCDTDRWVDEVIPDAPWVITKDFLDKHHIDYVAHDALPYADVTGTGKDVYEFVKAAGKFKETKRTDGISTSDIIMRIVKDYNQYVMRNLARGYSREELGVSYVKEKQLRVNMGITKLRQKVKEQQERVGQKLNTVARTAGMLHGEWVENADRWVSGFLEKFEEGCHLMESAIKMRIQKGFIMRPPQKRRPIKLLSGPVQAKVSNNIDF